MSPGTAANLTALDPRATPLAPGGKTKTGVAMAADGAELARLQEALYAVGGRRVLVVLQGMDTAGKGGVIEHVVGMFGPRASHPRVQEADRGGAAARLPLADPPGPPGPGNDRGVRPLALRGRARHPGARSGDRGKSGRDRYAEIDQFEAELVARAPIIKCFLNISYDAAGAVLARLADPDKHWKFNVGDIDERRRWADYQAAYRIAMRVTPRRTRRGTPCPPTARGTATGRSAGCCWRRLREIDPSFPPTGARREGTHQSPRAAQLMRIHLDTDFAGDTDDACALAYLLARDEVDLVGVTTVADADGRRAAYARYFLELAGRPDVPVAAGAARSLTTGEQAEPEHGDWPVLPPVPEPRAPRSTCSTGRSTPARP